MIENLAESGSLQSNQMTKAFGEITHRASFKPALGSRSRSTIGNHLRTTTLKGKRHDYQDRELSEAYNSAAHLPSLTRRDQVHRSEKSHGRPPALNSPEIKKLLTKYPDDARGRGDTIKDISRRLASVWHQCNEVLESDVSAKTEIQR